MSIIFFSKSFNSLACELFELHALKTKAIAIKILTFQNKPSNITVVIFTN